MKFIQIIILLIFVSSCKTEYEGLKRTEIHVHYPQKSNGKSSKINGQKRKIESRIYDKNQKLIQLWRYGGPGNWYTFYGFEPKNSNLFIANVNLRDYKDIDTMEEFEYNEKQELIKRKIWKFKNNRIDYLASIDTYDSTKDLVKSEVLNYTGDTEKTEIKTLVYPVEIEDEIFTQKNSNVRTKIPRTIKEEFIYDNKNKLEKIKYIDKDSNIVGYTNFIYKKIKKRTR